MPFLFYLLIITSFLYFLSSVISPSFLPYLSFLPAYIFLSFFASFVPSHFPSVSCSRRQTEMSSSHWSNSLCAFSPACVCVCVSIYCIYTVCVCVCVSPTVHLLEHQETWWVFTVTQTYTLPLLLVSFSRFSRSINQFIRKRQTDDMNHKEVHVLLNTDVPMSVCVCVCERCYVTACQLRHKFG